MPARWGAYNDAGYGCCDCGRVVRGSSPARAARAARARASPHPWLVVQLQCAVGGQQREQRTGRPFELRPPATALMAQVGPDGSGSSPERVVTVPSGHRMVRVLW